MAYKFRNKKGDIRTMVFEEYFDRFMNDRSLTRRGSNHISITQSDYELLKAKAESMKH